MADHVREQIAAAVTTALTNLTTTSTRVYRDRDTDASPLAADELPGLTIEDDGDPSEIITQGRSGIVERRMRVTVIAHVKAASGYSALLNTILKEIEIALAGAALGGAKSATIVEVAAREKSEAGDKPAVRQRFGFELLYYTARNAPDVAL